MIPVRALNIGAVPLLLFSPLHTGKGLEEPSDRQQLASQCLFGLLIHAPCGGRGGGNERTLLRLRLRATEPLSATQSFVVR